MSGYQAEANAFNENDASIKAGDVLRYYPSKVFNDHFMAIFLRSGQVKGVARKDIYESIEEWIQSMPLGGILYVNHRREEVSEETRAQYKEELEKYLGK